MQEKEQEMEKDYYRKEVSHLCDESQALLIGSIAQAS